MVFKLVSYRAKNGNVGDDFSEWLFSRALGDRLRPDGEFLLFGVGSILSRDLEAAFRDESTRACVVLGSGARGPESLPEMEAGHWKVYCVRGPLTARISSLPIEKAISDPAILAPRLAPQSKSSSGPIGIVPYFKSSEDAWRSVAAALDWRLISPRLSVEDFLCELASCSRVWCESMHGAIFADAYGIPWRPIRATSVQSEGKTHAFKWTDWCAAMGLGFDPFFGLPFPERPSSITSFAKERIKVSIVASRLEKASREDRYVLSNRRVLSEHQDQILEKIDKMAIEISGSHSKL